MPIQIKTERLVLRQFKQEDTNELHNICNQEYILKWMPDWGVPVERLKEVIKWFEECYLNTDPTRIRIMLAVTLKTDGRIIGLVGIGHKEEVDNEIEIAYLFIKLFHDNKNIEHCLLGKYHSFRCADDILFCWWFWPQ